MFTKFSLVRLIALHTNYPVKEMWIICHSNPYIWLAYDWLWAILNFEPHWPNVNHAFLQFRLEGHQEHRNKVRLVSPAKCLMGFEPQTFWFLLQCLNTVVQIIHTIHIIRIDANDPIGGANNPDYIIDYKTNI